MRIFDSKVVLLVAVMVSLLAISGYSQENTAVKTAAPAIPDAPVPDAAPQVKEIAIYGEVQSVDAAKEILVAQYYDYDSDSEKTSEIAVNSQVKFENASDLGGIKKGDWVDVTYIVKDGKNVAKVITVEKEELPSTEGEDVKTAAPAAGLPAEQ